MIEPITAVIVGLVIAATSSWITVKLSLKQFRTERWWERKADAYSAIIEALHDAKSFADLHLDAEYAGRKMADERGAELLARSHNARKHILKTMDVGAFVVSERAIARLKTYEKDSKNNSDCPNWIEYLESDWGNVDQCLSDIIAIAKSDLEL